jgi:plastocyanin
MRFLGVLGAASFLAFGACGGGGGDDGGTGPNPTQTLDRIQPSVTTLALNAGQSATIAVTAHDAQGGTIQNPGTFSFTSRSTTVAEVNSQGVVTAVSAGSTTIDISLSRSGVTKTATVAVAVTGTLPSSATVAAGTASNTFQPQVVAIARNGTVTWTFGNVLHNVTFSGAPGAPTNIPNTESANISRTFTTAGTFPYDCTLHAGMTGSVIVR